MKYRFKVIDKKTGKQGIPLRLSIVGKEDPEKEGTVFAGKNDYGEAITITISQFYPDDFELVIENIEDEHKHDTEIAVGI